MVTRGVTVEDLALYIGSSYEHVRGIVYGGKTNISRKRHKLVCRRLKLEDEAELWQTLVEIKLRARHNISMKTLAPRDATLKNLFEYLPESQRRKVAEFAKGLAKDVT